MLFFFSKLYITVTRPVTLIPSLFIFKVNDLTCVEEGIISQGHAIQCVQTDTFR